MYAIFLSIAGSFRFALMGAVRETLQFGRLAPQQQGGRDWIDKDISTKRYGFFIASWRQGVLLANAVAATRPQHEPLSILGKASKNIR